MLNNKINKPIEDTACLHAFKYISMMFPTTLIQMLLFHWTLGYTLTKNLYMPVGLPTFYE